MTPRPRLPDSRSTGRAPIFLREIIRLLGVKHSASADRMRQPISSLAIAFALAAIVSTPASGQQGGRKSEKVARTLSLAGTLVPAALDLVVQNGSLAVLGVAVGPSLGHFYANNGRRGVLGAIGRTGVLAIGMYAAFAPCGGELWLDCSGSELSDARLRAGAVGLLVLSWAALDIVQAPRSARRYNAAHTTAMIDWRPARPVQAPAPVTGCSALCASLVRSRPAIPLTLHRGRESAGSPFTLVTPFGLSSRLVAYPGRSSPSDGPPRVAP